MSPRDHLSNAHIFYAVSVSRVCLVNGRLVTLFDDLDGGQTLSQIFCSAMGAAFYTDHYEIRTTHIDRR